MYISEVMTGSAAVHQVLQPSNRNESHGRRRYALRAKKDRWTTWANCCSLSRGSVQRHNTDQAGVFSLGCEEFGYLERHYVRGVGFFTKLTSASWSSSCFGKLLGGLESPIAWNFIFNYPPPPPGWLVHKQFGRASLPPGTPSACRRQQQIRQHPQPQHHCVFMPSSLPSYSSFRPLPLGLKFETAAHYTRV